MQIEGCLLVKQAHVTITPFTLARRPLIGDKELEGRDLRVRGWEGAQAANAALDAAIAAYQENQS